MILRSVPASRARIRDRLEQALTEDQTPHEVAGSFAFGAFVTMLPTLGTGLLLFVALAAVCKRVSKIALFAPVLVFNPAVKWGVYGSSFWLGSAMLGPPVGGELAERSLSAGPEILLRLLVGNLVLAVLVGAASYLLVLGLAREYHRRSVEIVDLVPERVTE
jgi:uncharacterized protein (DUF2062 family)